MPAALCSYCLGETRIGASFQMGNVRKMDIYSTLSAEELRKNGTRSGFLALTFRPIVTFFKMFFIRFGFMDGLYGFILAVLYGHYTFLKYLKLWELSRNTDHKP
jgi:hypothetical protein